LEEGAALAVVSLINSMILCSPSPGIFKGNSTQHSALRRVSSLASKFEKGGKENENLMARKYDFHLSPTMIFIDFFGDEVSDMIGDFSKELCSWGDRV